MKTLKKKRMVWSTISIIILALLGLFILKTDTGNKFAFWLTDIFISHSVASIENPQFTTTAEELIKAFTKNQSSTQYIDKSILVSGIITGVESKVVILNQSLVCSIDSSQLDKISTLKINNPVNIQGRCIGYNDLMGEVSLDDCYIQ